MRFNRCAEYWSVLLRQPDARRKFAFAGIQDLECRNQPCESATLRLFLEIEFCFFDGVAGRVQRDLTQLAEGRQARIRAVGGGEEGVGVEEDSVDGWARDSSIDLFRTLVGNCVRVQAYFFDQLLGLLVIGVGCCAGEEEFGLALGRIDLDRQDGGRSDEDAVFAFFRDHERSLFDTKPPAELCGQHHGAASADLARQCFHQMAE